MATESQTPRTDAFERQLSQFKGQFDEQTYLEFARNLELELNEARKDVDRMNWLSGHPEITIYKGLFNGKMQWWLHSITPHNILFDSLSDAIDSAMKANK